MRTGASMFCLSAISKTRLFHYRCAPWKIDNGDRFAGLFLANVGTVLPFQIDRSDGSSCLEPTYIVCLTGITDRQKVGRLLTVLFWGEIG